MCVCVGGGGGTRTYDILIATIKRFVASPVVFGIYVRIDVCHSLGVRVLRPGLESIRTCHLCDLDYCRLQCNFHRCDSGVSFLSVSPVSVFHITVVVCPLIATLVSISFLRHHRLLPGCISSLAIRRGILLKYS